MVESYAALFAARYARYAHSIFAVDGNRYAAKRLDIRT